MKETKAERERSKDRGNDMSFKTQLTFCLLFNFTKKKKKKNTGT